MAAQQHEQTAADAAEARQQAAFPPPPPYFQLFRGAADGDDDAAQPPLLPPPLPAAPDATFQLFGELHTAQPGIPPLAVRQMYETQPDGTIDFRGELRRLNRELLFAFADMLGAVAGRPAQSARSVELVGILARNLQHLLNLLRPHQARPAFRSHDMVSAAATLQHLLERELREQREAVADLRQKGEAAQQLVVSAAEALVAVNRTSGTAGSPDVVPMDAEPVAANGPG